MFARAFLGVARNRAHIDGAALASCLENTVLITPGTSPDVKTRVAAGTVKVTAYEGLGSEDLPSLRPDECDLMVFPDGMFRLSLLTKRLAAGVPSFVKGQVFPLGPLLSLHTRGPQGPVQACS